ncbi:hypothetical protein FA13DRAFT_1786217 [Coprinellus micaceus]|uniref:Uncharacterized protein n=1 Tax=Coprinellus micaceus TaxID=71717 RepID=A0A4Y7TWA7_COPMI|nr:hypothetical protein FA13DRAFT_1786217 [Coprinellus micaceus]
MSGMGMVDLGLQDTNARKRTNERAWSEPIHACFFRSEVSLISDAHFLPSPPSTTYSIPASKEGGVSRIRRPPAPRPPFPINGVSLVSTAHHLLDPRFQRTGCLSYSTPITTSTPVSDKWGVSLVSTAHPQLDPRFQSTGRLSFSTPTSAALIPASNEAGACLFISAHHHHLNPRFTRSEASLFFNAHRRLLESRFERSGASLLLNAHHHLDPHIE